jgi:hypothetical protein
MDIFIGFINWLLGGVAESITWLVSLLPASPTSNWTNNKPANVTISHITWAIPFPTMILHFFGLLTAIGIYYVYRVIGRWLKVVRA